MDNILFDNDSLMREIQSIAKVGGWRCDLETAQVEWTEEAYHIHHLPANTRMDLYKAIDNYAPESRQVFHDAFQTSIRTKEPFDVNLKMTSPKTGEKLYIRCIGKPVLASDKVGQFVGAFQDISQQKGVETELKKINQEVNIYKSALSETKIIVITDLAGKIISVNENFTKSSGYKLSDVKGKTQDILKSGHHTDYFFKEQWSEILRGNIWKGEVLSKAKSGDCFWVDTTVIPILNEYGKPYQFMAISDDITERKETEKKIVATSERLSLATQSIKIGIWDYDIANGILHADDSLFHLFSISRSGDKNPFDQFVPYIHTSDKERLFELLREGINNGQEVSTDFRIVKASNEVRYFQLDTSTVKDNGKPVRMLGVCWDITRRKNYELELKRSENKLREAQRMAKLGSIEVDVDTNKTEWSDELYELLGIKRSTGNSDIQAFVELIHPEDKALFLEKYNRSLKQNKACDVEYRVLRPKDKEVLYLRSIFKTIKLEGYDKTSLLLNSIYDISDHKLKEKELAEAKEKAEQAAMAKSEFLSTMSHEIRTPLNSVVGLTNLLIEESPRKEQLEKLKALKFSSDSLLFLINDILDYNKIESGIIEFEQTPFSLFDLAENIRQSFLPRAREKDVKLKLTYDSQIPVSLMGDTVRLTQILTNLISNAIKFTDEGKVHVNIEMEGEAKDDEAMIRFSVEDTGIGIPEEKQQLIFERFTQASLDTTRRFGGTGLGLSISKKLLELMGSQIQLKSQVGEGSLFYFTLVFKVGKAQQIVPNPVNTLDQEPDLKGMRVLIVEDNEVSVFMLNNYLSKWNAKSDFAYDGEEAFEKIKSNTYDAVLMDLQMPKMSGYEVSSKVKKMRAKKYKELPIIALTASAFNSVKQKVTDAGMVDFLPKPFNANDLYNKLVTYGAKKSKTAGEAQNASVNKEGFNPESYSIEYILRIIGSEQSLIDNFISLNTRTFTEFKEGLEQAVKDEDPEQFRQVTHKIKPLLKQLSFEVMEKEIENAKQHFKEVNYKHTDSMDDVVKRIKTLTEGLLKDINERLKEFTPPASSK